MKNKISSWIKRYFLLMAPAPFVIGFLLGMGLAMFVGTLLLIFTPALHKSSTAILLAIGFGFLIGTLNRMVCLLFVSYRREPGLFMVNAYDPHSNSFKLVAAGNPLWGKGVWIDLPSTDRPGKPSDNSATALGLRWRVC